MNKMNCKVEKTKNANEVKLELTVEANRFDEAMKKVYFKTAKWKYTSNRYCN